METAWILGVLFVCLTQLGKQQIDHLNKLEEIEAKECRQCEEELDALLDQIDEEKEKENGRFDTGEDEGNEEKACSGTVCE